MTPWGHSEQTEGIEEENRRKAHAKLINPMGLGIRNLSLSVINSGDFWQHPDAGRRNPLHVEKLLLHVLWHVAMCIAVPHRPGGLL